MSQLHRDYFNNLAPVWEERMGQDHRFYHLIGDFNVRPGDRVLDLGAGTGRMTRILAQAVEDTGLVVAQDIAEEMLFEGRALLPDHHTAWLCEDACALSLRDDGFDKALCFSAFPHFQNQTAVIEEVFRVLKPGGSFLVLHTASSQRLNAFHQSLAAPVNKDRLPSSQDLACQMENAGFKLVHIQEEDDLYWVEAKKRH